MRKFCKKWIIIFAGIVLLCRILLIPVTVLAWGDSDGGRPEYTKEDINNGALGPVGADAEKQPGYPGTIVFNSISNSVIGHEFNFVGARKCILQTDGNWEGVTNETRWNGNNIDAEDGGYYIIRLYVHNDNPNGYNAVAEDTAVAFHIPTESSTTVRVNGFISSSNATPHKYVDYVDFNSEIPFHLEYIYGSALLENNGIGEGGLTISDDVVNNADGTFIGYDKLDGRIPGGHQYDNFVSVKVKVIYDYEFTIENQVRLHDSEDKSWHSAVEAKVGDKVDFQLTYRNTSEFVQNNVVLKDILPNNLKYVEGSTMLKNSSFPNGTKLTENNLVDNGIKIGHYGPNAAAYVMFTAEVVDNSLACGANSLNNWVHTSVGYTNKEDSATVHVMYMNKKNKVIFATLIVLMIACLASIIVSLYKIYRWKKSSR